MNRKVLKTVALNAFDALPEALQDQVVKGFIRHKLGRIKKLLTPTVLIFFITSRCNNRCAHCFYWEELNTATDELSLEEIRQIAASLRHPVHLSLTGGEPFLRNDIVDICEAFSRSNGCANIGIATNGYLTERIIRDCGEILKLPLEGLGVQVSLDGLEETHNQIRGVKDSYKKTLATIVALARLAEEERRFSVSVNIAIQQKNFTEVEALVTELVPLGIPIRFALIRGQNAGTYGLSKEFANSVDPLEDDAPVKDLAALEGLFQRLKVLNETALYRFWSERQQEKIRLSLQMMRNSKSELPCYAGKVEGVLYANGEVALCELSRPVGNLREYDLDFQRLWSSKEAERMRNGIRNCFCIHGCNLVTSMMYTPGMVKDAIEKMRAVKE